MIGAGPTGLCTAMCARLYSPARLVVIDHVPTERLEFAKAHGLADLTINPLRGGPARNRARPHRRRGADRVFEVAGGRNTFEMAWRLARCSGTVCLVAHYEEDPQKLPLREMYGKNLVFKTGGVHANACAKTSRSRGGHALTPPAHHPPGSRSTTRSRDTGCLKRRRTM